MALLNLSLLGGFRARLASGSDVEIPRKKAQALLAYLGLYPGQSFLRDKLASLLWGDLPDEQARHNLRQTLFALRAALPARPPSLLSDGEAVGLAPDAVEVDVVTYERLAAEATPDALAGAASLYQGDFLDGFVVEEAPFEEWLRTERERLREVALEVLAKLLAHQMKGEALEPAIQTALRLLALDPFQETTHRTLMRLYVRQGRRAAALRQYQLCVDVLQRELGAEPEAVTRQLYQQILPERVTTATAPEPPSPLETRPRRRSDRRRRGPRVTLDAPLIGRATEMDRLRQLLHEARRGRGTAALIVGEAGVGKTRLVEELEALAVRRDVKVLAGRAYETAQVLPFGPWIDALRTGIVAVQATLRGFDAVWRAELGRLFPELDTPEPASMSGDALRLFEAVTRFIAYLAQREPLMLILEDLHWADEMSLRLLAFIGRRIENSPVLLIASAREEDLADVPLLGKSLAELRRHSGLVDVALRPLSRDDTATLIGSLAAVDTPDFPRQRLEDHVWKVSEGNPFLALETLRAVYESTSNEDPLTLPFPKRVRELVVAHLDRLSDRSRQLVAIASVIGREFDFALLQRVAGLGDRDTAEAVEELVRRRVLRGVNEHLDFTHDRIRETALSQLLPVQRRLLHREIGAAIETLCAQNLEPHYAALALHHREGAAWDKALLYLRKAAAQALARSAYQQAAAFLEQALDALRHLPETRDTIEQAIDVRCDLRISINPLADDRVMLKHLETAKVLAERIGDRRRVVRALTYLAREHFDLGAYAKSIKVAQEALAVARALGDRALEVAPTFYMALSYVWHGDFRRAIEVIKSSVESIPDGQRPDHHGLVGTAAVFYRTKITESLGALGTFDEGIVWGKESLRLAEAAGHPYGLGSAYLELGALYVARGAADEALPLLERGLDLSRTRDIRLYIRWTAATLALAYALVGRTADARALLDEMPKEGFSQRPKRSLDSLPLLLLGHTYLVLGRPDEAAWFGQRALEIAREFNQRGAEAGGLRLVGDLLSRHDSPGLAEAEVSYRQALALAGELGLRPLVAHCHAGLARVFRRAGEREQAQDHFANAARMFREMEMRFWLEEAEQEGAC